MKILLLGEYSNVHATLAEGLRAIGHEVTVASNGDFWKNYPRDIDLSRKPGKIGGLRLLAKAYTLLPRWRGYDVVQLINPMFLELKAERLFSIYRYLRKHNKRVVLGAYGMDWYWVHECTYNKPLRYSDFNIGDQLRTDPNAIKEQEDWLHTAKEKLNKLIAEEADAIVTGLYEYQVCYEPYFPQKTRFIPYPIKSAECSANGSESATPVVPDAAANPNPNTLNPKRIRLFIGISKGRSVYKGTDIMLRAAEEVQHHYPERLEIIKAEGVPFSEYEKMLNGSDAILDQLYAYTPAMNALLAMSKGIICIGGGEPENYAIIHENELRPIINVGPTYESVYEGIENLVLEPERVTELKRQSIEYVRRHHDYLKVAREYEELYLSLNKD